MSALDSKAIAVEAAAIAMGRATRSGAHAHSMRTRRELAALAYDSIIRSIATDLRAEGERLQDVSVKVKSAPGMAHALSFGDASTWLLTTHHQAGPAPSTLNGDTA